jgi:1-acyl-sn-glycerol-3-phosphate acyltransferase
LIDVFTSAFLFFFRFWMRSRLDRVFCRGGASPLISSTPEQPVLLVANHVSWWDGFLLAEFQRTLLPAYSLRVAMDEIEYFKRPWMRWLGVIPLDRKNPLGFLGFLRLLKKHIAQVNDRRLCLLFFPQGELCSAHKRPLGFRRGAEIVAREISPCRILPVAIHMDWGTTPEPRAWISAGVPIDSSEMSLDGLELLVEQQLDSIQSFLSKAGERAPELAREAGFVPLACGRSG